MLIFNKDSDHYEWAKRREFVAAMNDIDEDLRKKLILAYEILEQELGKGFLKSSHHNHPIRQMIANLTVWQIEELIQFTETIQVLKQSDSGYPELKKLLLPNVKALEQGVPFLKIAQAYIKENFKVNFPNDINNDKSPDIEIIDPQTKDHFYIEVSTINESKERAIRNENYQFLRNQFYNLRPHLLCICKQKDVIEKYNYPKVESIISQAKGKVLQPGQTIYFSDKSINLIKSN